MHIIMGIIGIISLVAIWYWRLQMLRGAAHEAGKLAESAVNLPRRLAFRAKTRQRGTAILEEPTEAAMMLMLITAGADNQGGQVNESQVAAMMRLAVSGFDISKQEAEDLIVQAEFLLRDMKPGRSTLRKLALYLLDEVGPQGCEDVAAMLDAVAHVGGEPSPAQDATIAEFMRAAGMQAT